MSGGQKKVMYKVRWCIRCGEYYRTAHKFSRCCTNCYKQPVNNRVAYLILIVGCINMD